MSTVADLRERIDDSPKFKTGSFTGNGTTTRFKLTSYPIVENSGTFTIAGSAYGTAGYALNGTLGLITFGTAPASAAAILAEYQVTQIDGTILQNILTRHGGDLELSAAEALEKRAAGAASYFSFISGDVKVDKTKTADNFMKLAEQIRANYYAEERQPTVDSQVEWEYQDQEQTGD